LITYFKRQPQVCAVYLFGSYAKERSGPTSDVDIGVVLKPGEVIGMSSPIACRERFLVDLSRRLRKDPHLVVMNLANTVLLKQIFLTGRCLVVNDPPQLSMFKMAAYARIADFGYYHHHFKTIFARKLMEG
jgi:predicted nucleotidyltransferase